MKRLLQESQVVNLYVVYLIIKKLTTAFKDTPAFRLGIIDEKGNVLRKRRTLKTVEEQEASTPLDIMIWKLKRMLELLPGGKSKLASFATALWLLKEEKNYDYYLLNEDMFKQDFKIYITDYKPSKREDLIREELEYMVSFNDDFKEFLKD